MYENPNYEALRQKAQEKIERERIRMERELSGWPELFQDIKSDVEYEFDRTSQGLRAFIGIIENSNWPIGPNFERNQELYASDKHYRFMMDRIQTHLGRLASLPSSTMKATVQLHLANSQSQQIL
jgi:hypothetical protein